MTCRSERAGLVCAGHGILLFGIKECYNTMDEDPERMTKRPPGAPKLVFECNVARCHAPACAAGHSNDGGIGLARMANGTEYCTGWCSATKYCGRSTNYMQTEHAEDCTACLHVIGKTTMGEPAPPLALHVYQRCHIS